MNQLNFMVFVFYKLEKIDGIDFGQLDKINVI